MHEFSVMSQVVSAIIPEAEKRNAIAVKVVHLEVGILTSLGKEQLTFAYEVLTKGTVLEGSELSIADVQPEVKCTACQYSGPVDYLEDPFFHNMVPRLSCPECGGKVDVLKGLECNVRDMRITVEDQEG